MNLSQEFTAVKARSGKARRAKLANSRRLRVPLVGLFRMTIPLSDLDLLGYLPPNDFDLRE
jgi:hypothetical protein